MEGETNGSTGDHEENLRANEEEVSNVDVGTSTDPEPAPAPPVVVKHFHFNILGSNVAETENVLRSLMHAVGGHQLGTIMPQLSIQGAPGAGMQGWATPAGAAMQGPGSSGAMQGPGSSGAMQAGPGSSGAMQGPGSSGAMLGSSSLGAVMQGPSSPVAGMQGSGSPATVQFMQGSPGPLGQPPAMQGPVSGPSASASMMGSPVAAGPSFSASEPSTSGSQTAQLLAQALLQRRVGRPSRAQLAVQRAALEAASSMVSSPSVAAAANNRPICKKCQLPRSDHILTSCGHPVCSNCIAVWPIAQGNCPCGTPCNSTNLLRLNQ